MTRAPAEQITTKDPRYIALRKKLDYRWSVLYAEDVALLLGYTDNTVREFARDGKLKAMKQGGNKPWEFDVNGIREEIGLEPLSDWIG